MVTDGAPGSLQSFHGTGHAESHDAIRDVLRSGALSIVFHQIVHLDTRAMLGAEAMARLNPDASSAPLELFAQASSEGMITEMELLAIEKAVFWMRQLPGDTSLFVNASTTTVLSEAFDLILDDPSVASRLVVEISATTPVPSYLRLGEAVASLRARGARLAIDDLAADQSSLARMARMRPDLVKLGPAITRGLPLDDHMQTLVRQILAVADDLGAETVAEGISTEAELTALLDAGVPYGQGFLFGDPIALA